ncbi:MAG TPA: hypothetical protein VGQ06_00230 [Gemmatimonadales bacterium]|nr:hypothetical protein [Gemmatimonadales bacterium]
MGRRGIKEFRAPEALALIAADRDHQPLVCPSCGTRTIQRVPRRRLSHPHPGDLVATITAPAAPGLPATPAERISLTCSACGRHAFYIARGPEPPRDATMDPRSA